MILKFKNKYDPSQLTQEQLETEIKLINNRQSKLSAKERNFTVGYYFYLKEKEKTSQASKRPTP